MIEGYYYLHENGSLIYKRAFNDTVADFRESPFVKMFWAFNSKHRKYAWRILVESLAIGANKKRVFELADKWECNDIDAKNYADYVGFHLGKDGDQYCAKRKDFINLQESPAGFGDTALEAISNLCKELGYIAQKTWGNTFENLIMVKSK